MVERNGGKTALRKKSHNGLHGCAFTIHIVGSLRYSRRVEQAHHVAEESTRRSAHQRDTRTVGAPTACIVAKEANSAFCVFNVCRIGELRG